MGTEGVYTHTVAYEKDPACPICSPGVPFTVQPSLTLREVRGPPAHCCAAAVSCCAIIASENGEPLLRRTVLDATFMCNAMTVQPSSWPLIPQVLEKLQADPVLGQHLTRPSVSYGSTNLYMRGALEEETSPNLDKVEGLPEGC